MATAPLLDDQVGVIAAGLLSVLVPAALNGCVSPLAIVAVGGETAMDCSTAGRQVIVAVLLTLPFCAVMVAEPLEATQVATPVVATIVATAGVFELQLTLVVMSGVVPSE